MNPPPTLPFPPPAPKPAGKTFAHQAAMASLLAPLLAILASAGAHAASQGQPASRAAELIIGLMCLMFIVTGFTMAIIGLCGIRQNGPRGILGRSVAGLVINGLLLIFFVISFMAGLANGVKSRQFTQDLQSTVQDMQANARQSYNPKTGITNVDLKSLNRIQNQFDNAAKTLSGDDALISQAMSRYVARMQDGLEKYNNAASKLRAAEVLNLETLSDKGLIAPRRALVQDFIAANDELKAVMTNSEDSIRADLTSLNVAPQEIDQAIAGFDSKFTPRRALVLQIRECDDHMGQAMTGILDLLETNWGKWNYDPTTNLVQFEDADAQSSYHQFLAALKAASQEQIKAQGELVNLPQ